MGPFKSGWDERDVEAVVARGDPAELLYVPIAVGMNADVFERSWAEEQCFSLAQHPHFNVRGNALLGLGHIARVCGALDTARAGRAISQGLRDPHEYVRGHAEDAAADLEMYLNFRVPGYDGAHTTEILDAIDALRKKHEI
jgi:hypothetical protein